MCYQREKTSEDNHEEYSRDLSVYQAKWILSLTISNLNQGNNYSDSPGTADSPVTADFLSTKMVYLCQITKCVIFFYLDVPYCYFLLIKYKCGRAAQSKLHLPAYLPLNSPSQLRALPDAVCCPKQTTSPSSAASKLPLSAVWRT